MLKLSENPPVIAPSFRKLEEMEGRWWVAHTKARAEKAFAWDLVGRGVGYFLPMVERVTFSGGRKRRGMAPLFPSYVFFCGTDDSRYAALTTDRLCQVIEAPDQRGLVRELVQLERAIAEKGKLEYSAGPMVGRRYRVNGGPFQGLEGVVVREAGRARIELRVSLLGQGATLEIEPELLDALERETAASREGVSACRPSGGRDSSGPRDDFDSMAGRFYAV